MDRCIWGISGVSRETECAKVYKYIYKSCLLRKWVAFRGACCWLSLPGGQLPGFTGDLCAYILLLVNNFKIAYRCLCRI